jgi:sulfoxide reductase heme-binding subunit YedZ
MPTRSRPSTPAWISGATSETVSPKTYRRALRVTVFLACLAPLVVLLADLFGGRLGPEPIRAVELRTGIWALTLLVATLAVTPLRRLTGWNVLGGYRRMLGLWAFAYVCLHFLTWFGVDQFFALAYIGKDIVKRPYITVGFASFLLMIPLAITSRTAMVRRLGKRWATLHSLVYVAALGGVVHFVWEVKADLTRPTIYALIIVGLLLLRFLPRRARRPRPSPAPRERVPTAA